MRAIVLLTSLFVLGCGRSTSTDVSQVPVADTNAAPAGDTNAAPAGDTNAAPAGDTNAAPAGDTNAAPAADTNAAPAADTSAAPAGDAAPAADANAVAGDTNTVAGDTSAAPAGDASTVVEPRSPFESAPRTGPPLGEGWCVLLGTVPLEGRGSGYTSAYDRAYALAKKARDAGFAKAGIYDAREFTSFTWGQLVVIGALAADEAAAKAIAAEAKKAQLNPFVKECSGPTAQPIEGWDQIPRPALLEKSAPNLDSFDVTAVSGCFAWSERESRALCRRSETSIQAGGADTIEVLPASPDFEPIVLAKYEPQHFDEVKLTLAPEAKKRLAAEIARGHYVSLTAENIVRWMRPIAPKGVLRWSPNLAVTWKRKTTRQTIPQAGSWNDHEDTLVVTCGTLSFDWVVETHSDDAPEAFVGYVPGGAALLLGWSDHWTIEGDGGGSTHGAVFDLTPCAEALAKP
jgi:hypothetical protein